jgi:hypothetical protein
MPSRYATEAPAMAIRSVLDSRDNYPSEWPATKVD